MEGKGSKTKGKRGEGDRGEVRIEGKEIGKRKVMGRRKSGMKNEKNCVYGDERKKKRHRRDEEVMESQW